METCIHCGKETNMHQRLNKTCWECGKPIKHKVIETGLTVDLTKISFRNVFIAPMAFFDRGIVLTLKGVTDGKQLIIDDRPAFADNQGNVYITAFKEYHD